MISSQIVHLSVGFIFLAESTLSLCSSLLPPL